MEKGTESLFKEIIDDKFPNLDELDIQEGQRTPSYLNTKRHSLRHIILNWQKSMLKNCKSSQGKRRK